MHPSFPALPAVLISASTVRPFRLGVSGLLCFLGWRGGGGVARAPVWHVRRNVYGANRLVMTGKDSNDKRTATSNCDVAVQLSSPRTRL